MIYKDEQDLIEDGILDESGQNLVIGDESEFRETVIDRLHDTIILSGSKRLRKVCTWAAFTAADHFGVVPCSIQGFYEARAVENLSGFSVPAINLRTLTYDLARAVFRAARKISACAFIFEIARSEIGYTDQRPMEYTSAVLLAAVREGFEGPVFIQGDHFQLNAGHFHEDRAKEIAGLKELVTEAVKAGFYNIDIDSSTLVDLSCPVLDEQQRLNYEVCAQFTEYIRGLQPEGVDISIGGEIGEVGKKNSTPEELRAFMKGYNTLIGDLKGLSKMSIQTGTSHGGVVLPDGSIAKVKIDFDTLKALSEIARKEFGMAGAVQHGASTLPDDAFHHFPKSLCAEVHLATQFQNIVYEYIPEELEIEIYRWLHENMAGEKKEGQTDDQFIYKTRKKALGPFKKKIHSLPVELRDKISSVLERKFSFLFNELNIKNTREVVDRTVKPVHVIRTRETFLMDDKEFG